jgi:hypothetical protein
MDGSIRALMRHVVSTTDRVMVVVRRYAEAATSFKVPAKAELRRPAADASPRILSAPLDTHMLCVSVAIGRDTEGSSVFQGVEFDGRHRAIGQKATGQTGTGQKAAPAAR